MSIPICKWVVSERDSAQTLEAGPSPRREGAAAPFVGRARPLPPATLIHPPAHSRLSFLCTRLLVACPSVGMSSAKRKSAAAAVAAAAASPPTAPAAAAAAQSKKRKAADSAAVAGAPATSKRKQKVEQAAAPVPVVEEEEEVDDMEQLGECAAQRGAAKPSSRLQGQLSMPLPVMRCITVPIPVHAPHARGQQDDRRSAAAELRRSASVHASALV